MLYEIFHCRKSSYANHDTFYNSYFDYSDSQDFIGELSKNNSGKGTWEPGWEIRNFTKNGQLVVQKDGLRLWVYPHQFLIRDSVADIGKKGYIHMVKEFRQLMPGFYMALGDTPEDEIPDRIIVRLYWNIKSPYSGLLMKSLTTELNAAEIPFRLKILNDPRSYPRADGAVLYISKQYFQKAHKKILKIYEKVQPYLESLTPLFSKILYPGLALAEDPNNNESFGQHRCRIFSEAILTALQKKDTSSGKQKIAEVYAYFKSLSLNLDSPYLNSGSKDDYDLFP